MRTNIQLARELLVACAALFAATYVCAHTSTKAGRQRFTTLLIYYLLLHVCAHYCVQAALCFFTTGTAAALYYFTTLLRYH
jgi:hypothetical protein